MNDIIFENELAIVAIIKNESRYIQEWLDYHYRIGVDKFYIYNNDSDDTDELEKILQPWIQNHIIDYKIYPGKFKQIPAYNDALEKHRFDCRYIAFIDLDEFIFVKNGQSLPEFLHEHFSKDPQISGLGINWRMFGTSGKQFYEPIDVIDRFTFRNKDVSSAFKTILNPRRALMFTNPHEAKYLLDSKCCNEVFDTVQMGINTEYFADKIQLNHYSSKSVEEYYQKIRKGRATCDQPRSNIPPYYGEIEDVELKTFYHQLKLKPLPQIKDHSPQIIIKNISTMLKSNLNSIESILTCFYLIKQSELFTTVEKSQLTDYLMTQLKNVMLESELQPYECSLMMLSAFDIGSIDTENSKYILKLLLQISDQLIELCELQTRHQLWFALKQIKKYLLNGVRYE